MCMYTRNQPIIHDYRFRLFYHVIAFMSRSYAKVFCKYSISSKICIKMHFDEYLRRYPLQFASITAYFLKISEKTSDFMNILYSANCKKLTNDNIFHIFFSRPFCETSQKFSKPGFFACRVFRARRRLIICARGEKKCGTLYCARPSCLFF